MIERLRRGPDQPSACTNGSISPLLPSQTRDVQITQVTIHLDFIFALMMTLIILHGVTPPPVGDLTGLSSVLGRKLPALTFTRIRA